MIKATKKYHNPLETIKSEVSNKPLFSERDWKLAQDTGRLDLYSAALINSDDVDVGKFYSDYGLLYGSQDTRLDAIINESFSDKNTKKKYNIQQFENNGQPVYTVNEKNEYVPLFVEQELTDYEYGKLMIQNQNKVTLYNRTLERLKFTRDEANHFVNTLGDVAAVPLNLLEGVYGAVSDIFALIAGIGNGIFGEGEFGDDFLKGINYYISNDGIRNWASESLRDFEYNYTHYMDDEGEYNVGGQIAAGVSESIGKYIPAMLIGYGVGAAASGISTAAGASATAAAKTASIASQVASTATFYSTVVFTEDVNEQYEYFKSQGMTPPSGAIISSSLVKSALQAGVEYGLGKLLGATGLDNIIFGRTGKGALTAGSTKSLTKDAVIRFVKDSAQEGLEEALQETTDFLVNAYMYNFTNHGFDDVEWDWSTIGLSFVMGCISSLAMNGAKIVGTKKVETGIKITNNGEIINGEFETLGKFASWQYGYNLDSFVEGLNDVRLAGEKIKNINKQSKDGKLNKAETQFAMAYQQSLGALQLMLDLYGEVGAEKMTAANKILDKITSQINEGVFDVKTVDEVIESLTIDFKSLGILNSLELAKKAQKNGTTAVDSVFKSTDDTNGDNSEVAKAMDEIYNVSGEKYDETVITKDGKRAFVVGNTLVIPKHLLLNGEPRMVLESVAESQLADQLVEGVIAKKHYFKNEMSILSDLYAQWSGTEDFNEDEVIFNLIFDPRFFEAVLSVNEKLTSTYLLRLNGLLDSIKDERKLKTKLLNKKLKECKERWIKAAIHFYANNLNVISDEFTSSLTSKEKIKFDKELMRTVQLYNLGESIVLKPDSVKNEVWEFISRRINNMNVEESVKTQLNEDIKNDNPTVREKALMTISDYYEGAFMTLYDGKHYLTKDTFTNEVFNSFLEKNGLFVYQLFDEKYLTSEELDALGENIDEDSILQLRREQLNRYNPTLQLDYKNGNIVIKSTLKDEPDGFQTVQSYINSEKGKIVTGQSFKIGDDKITRKFATSVKYKDKWFKEFLSNNIINDYMSDYFTVDDIVNHPEYISSEYRDIIQQDYGRVDKITTYQFFAKHLSDTTNGKQSLVILQDGTVAIGDMTALNDLYVDGVILPNAGTHNLSEFISSDYLNGVLGTCRVIISNKISQPEYIDYQSQVDIKTGKSMNVFVNTIMLPISSQSYMKFALAHEMQHALQVQWKMNQGISSKPLELFDDNTAQKIVNDVMQMSPELFANIEENRRNIKNPLVRKIVDEYIYYGSGETQAMGLGGVSQFSYYPIRVTRKNGNTVITFKNGHKYSVKNEIDSKYASKMLESEITKLYKHYEGFNITQSSAENLRKMYKAGIDLGIKISKQNNVKPEEYQEHIYYTFGSDKTLEDFKNSKVIIVTLNDNQYVVKNTDDITKLIHRITPNVKNDEVTVTISYTLVKNIKSFDALNGKVKVNKSDLKGRRYGNVDVSQIPMTHTVQNLDTSDMYSAFTGNKLDEYGDYSSLSLLMSDFAGKPTRTTLRSNTLSYALYLGRNDAITIDDVIGIYKNNEKLYDLLYRYLYRVWGDITDSTIKEDLYNAITNEDTEKSIKDAITSVKNISYEEFLDLDIPVYRYQQGLAKYDDKFLSFTSLGHMDVYTSMQNVPYRHYDSVTRSGFILTGTIKVKDCKLLIRHSDNWEFFASFDKISNMKYVEFKVDENNKLFKSKILNVSNKEYFDDTFIVKNIKDLESDIFYNLENWIEDGNSRMPKEYYLFLHDFATKLFEALKVKNTLRKNNLLPEYYSVLSEVSKEHTRILGSANFNGIWLNYDRANVETVLHEIIHLLTVDAIEGLTDNKFLNDAGTIIKGIYDKLISQSGIKKGSYYGLKNPYEMIAELSNPDFRDFLSKQELTGPLLYTINRILDFKLQNNNVLDLVEGTLNKILKSYNYSNSNQSLADLSELDEYGIYQGIIFKNGKQWKSAPEFVSSILVLDSKNKTMQKLKEKLIKQLSKHGLNVDSDTNLKSYLKILQIDEPAVFNNLINEMQNWESEVSSILLGNEFILLNGEIVDNITIQRESNVINTSESVENSKVTEETVETKKESSIEESEDSLIEDSIKPKRRKKKVDFIEVDNRTEKEKELSKKFNPKKTTIKFTTNYSPDEYASKGMTPSRVITKSELNEDTLEGRPLGAPANDADYFFRDFVERRIYNVGGEEKIRDIYVYYKYKKYDKRRHVWEDEIENTNLTHFKKDKKQLQMNPSLREFIIASTNVSLDRNIENLIKTGKLKISDLEEYITQKPSEMDLTTFKLINEHVFKNPYINTPEELGNIALGLGPQMAAMYLVLKDTDDFSLISNENIDLSTPEKIENVWKVLSQMPKYSNDLNKILEAFAYNVSLRKFSRNKAAEGQYDVLEPELLYKQQMYQTLRFFDGDIATGSRAILHARDLTYLNSLSPGDGFREVKFGRDYFEANMKSLEDMVGQDKEGKESTKSFLDTIGSDDEFIKNFGDNVSYLSSNSTINKIKRSLLEADGKVGSRAYRALALYAKSQNKTRIDAKNYWSRYKEQINKLNEDELYDWYKNFIEKSSQERLNEIFALASISTENLNLIETLNKTAQDIVNKIPVSASKAQGIRRRTSGTLKNLVKGKNKKYLFEVAGDILNDDFTLKVSAYKDTVDGKTVYKTNAEMDALNERIGELIIAARNGAFDTRSKFDTYLKIQQNKLDAIKELNKSLTRSRTITKTVKEKVVKETIKYVPISYYDVDGENTIHVDSNKKIPKILEDVLKTGLSKKAKTDVKNLSLENEEHLVSSIQNIFDENYTKLFETSEDEALEFLDFFVNHGIMSTDSEMSRIAIDVERMLAAYFLARHRFGPFNFEPETVEAVRKRLNDLGSWSGQLLNNQKVIAAMLDPNKTRAQNLSRDLGIELDDEDKANLDKLLKGVQTNKSDYLKSKKNFEQTLLKKYKGSKKNIWSKLLQFERAMMLSNPGTWLRNIASNFIVEGGNIASAKIGDSFSKLIFKAFPKSKRALLTDEEISYTLNTKDGPVEVKRYQYKMNKKLDKKVDENIINFIHSSFEKSGLIDETIRGLSKYNLDKLEHNPSQDNLTDMIARSIAVDMRAKEIFARGKYSESKIAEKVDQLIGFIYERISDDPWVKRTTIRYLGKILKEDFIQAKKVKPNLTFNDFVNTPDSKNNIYGIGSHIATAYTKAFNLASADYMRNPNMITFIERTLRDKMGKGGYFIYKQFFPFLSASWSWCMEALRYSPAGLAKSIIDLAKLENTVAKMDKKHQQGESIVHSEFARYTVLRNLGKGTIGVGLFTLGMLLYGLGLAGIDEEDKEYKLIIGDVKISIDDVLASQSITMGIALFDNINNEDSDVFDILSQTFNQLFRDSLIEDLFNTVRYNKDVSSILYTKSVDAAGMFVPGFFKSLSSVIHHQGVKYNNNSYISRLQRLALQVLPFAPAEWVGATTQIDIYTGEAQNFFSGNLFSAIISKFSPIDVSTLNASENELEAISYDVKKGNLTGNYSIDGEKIKLTSDETLKLNQFYGKLNKKDLTSLRNNSVKIKVQTEDGKYKDLYYNQMTDKQKSAAINNLMSNNSTTSKIYVLTSTNKYKYYANDNEYKELKKLGITQNVYRQTDKQKGFVKI